MSTENAPHALTPDTADKLRREMARRLKARESYGMPFQRYVEAAAEVMFEVTAEHLASLPNAPKP